MLQRPPIKVEPTYAGHGSLFGFDKITITALVAGAVNVVGGAAAAKGWLIDLGVRYYDAMSEQFGMPRGFFVPSETRLVETGFKMLASFQGLICAGAVFAFTFNLLFIIASQHQIRRRNNADRLESLNDGEKYNGVRQMRRSLTWARLVVISTLLLVAVSVGAMAVMVRYARRQGEEVSARMIQEVSKPNCPQCKNFGPKKLSGISVFVDQETLFVTPKGGGLVRMPLKDMVVTPVKRMPS